MKMKNSDVTLIIIVVIVVLIFIGFSGTRNEDRSDNEAIKQKVEDKYNSSGTIDCTGANSQTPECKYLLGLPSDVGGSWQP